MVAVRLREDVGQDLPVLVLQEMLEGGTRRALRIQKLNRDIAELAERRAIVVRMYPRAELRESFAYHYGAMTKQRIAETIATHILALNLYVPPARKPWMSEHARMGLFDAAAFAWMYFHDIGGERQAA